MQNTSDCIIYSTYQKEDRVATVVKHRISNSWGVHMKIGNKPGLLEFYPTHSEVWAEECAENFVEGIKQL